jgi:hypothetical protein
MMECSFVGPSNVGEEAFDKNCLFGNNMHLSKEQQDFLHDLCHDFGAPAIKYYVHKMTNSNIIEKKCKMVRSYKSSLKLTIFTCQMQQLLI